MKKLLTAFGLILFSLGILLGQNPTIVRPTNGVENATLATTGSVIPRLKTNAIDLTKAQVYGHDASGNFQWYDTNGFGGAATSPGTPTNSVQYNFGGAFTGEADFSYDQASNRVTVGAIRSASRLTNQAPSFILDSEGDIQFGGNAVLNAFGRDANGGVYIGPTNTNSKLHVGGSMSWRGSAVSANATIGNGDTSIMYAADASGGSFNHILPAINSNLQKVFMWTKTDTTTNGVNICSASGTAIDVSGQTNVTLRLPGDSVMIWNDNTANVWRTYLTSRLPRCAAATQLDAKVVSGNAISYNLDTTFFGSIFVYQAPPATGDTLDYGAFTLARGTNYCLDVWYSKDANAGILNVYYGSQLLASIDQYAAASAKNQLSTTVGIAITNTEGRVQIKINGKNASSSDFYTYVNRWRIYYKQ